MFNVQTLEVTSGVMGKYFDILIFNSETKTENSEYFIFLLNKINFSKICKNVLGTFLNFRSFGTMHLKFFQKIIFSPK
jgi:hypothetical protein